MVHKTCFFASEGYDTRFQPMAITAELHLILKQFSALTAFILTFIWFDYWLICSVFVLGAISRQSATCHFSQKDKNKNATGGAKFMTQEFSTNQQK